METSIQRLLTSACCAAIRQGHGQIVRCAALLGDAHIWERANSRCNSVANLMLHLKGNVSQWILAGLAKQQFQRDRPAEFAARPGLTAAQLISSLTATIEAALGALAALSERELVAVYDIQGYQVSGVEAVVHVTEHYSFHAGQIVHVTKALLDVDLSLYDPQGRRLADTGGKPW